MQQLNDAENLFLDEIRTKKKETASLRDSQKHKRMGKGSIRFASDFMSRKERKKHMGASEIMTSNIYDTILPADEFKALETYEQKNRLSYLRMNYSNKEIMAKMGLTNAQYYALVNELGLPKAPRSHEPEKRRQPREAKLKTKPAKDQEQPKWRLEPKQVETPAPVQEIIVNGMHLVFNGTYSPEELQRQLLKYAGLLDGENDEFYIELKLVQKAAAKK